MIVHDALNSCVFLLPAHNVLVGFKVQGASGGAKALLQKALVVLGLLVATNNHAAGNLCSCLIHEIFLIP